MKTLTKAVLIPTCVFSLGLPLIANAGEDKNNSMSDAWLDGKLDTVILLNEHLNPFEIDTDVTNKIAVISGEVDSSVEKSLVTELAKSIEGIEKVDNRLQVIPEMPKENKVKTAAKEVGGDFSDAAITTAISTKLMLNTDINSLKIDVDTDNGEVKLNGSVETKAEKDLVEQIAKNTFDVKEVTNLLEIDLKS